MRLPSRVSLTSSALSLAHSTQRTATPVIAGYLAYPTSAGAGTLPGLVQIHGGGQRANANLAKFWAEQGYAAISINWGGFNLHEQNSGEPLPGGYPATLYANTGWDGLAAGFARTGSALHPVANPVTDAYHRDNVDPQYYSDGSTLHSIAHPMNSSWVLNGYAARRAITYLQSLPEVDDTKIGVLGWSMGGRSTIMTSTDPRITVIAPGVGGCGFLFEDWWAQQGTARGTNGWVNFDLFKNTVDNQSYWPHISAPAMFMEAANDFNAPFDLTMKALSLHETGLGSVTPNTRLVSDPHYNHRMVDQSWASRVHWMRHHLKGDAPFDEFPEISDSTLDMNAVGGVPVFTVTPDASTGFAIDSVDVYYGIDRDSRIRFWRNAETTDDGTTWTAQLPINNVDEMMAVYAVVTYNAGFTQKLQLGAAPTDQFTLASKVHTYYPTGVDTTGYTYPQDLDTAIHQIHLLDPDTLVTNGLRETAEISYAIDDPSDSDGLKDWYLLNATNTSLWQYFTRKISDPSFTGGDGAQFTFDLTATVANTLIVKIIVDDWNENANITYIATVPISAGANSVSLSLSDFLLQADGSTALDDWSRAKFIGFGSEQTFGLGASGWSGALPELANLAWLGGEHVLDNGITSTWLQSNGLALSNDIALQDSEGDGVLNLQEFAFGLDPNLNDSSELTVNGASFTAGMPAVDVSFSPLSVNARFIRLVDHASSAITYTAQFSNDLTAWEDVAGSTAVRIDGTSDASGYEAVEMEYPLLLSNGRKAQFFRMQINSAD